MTDAPGLLAILPMPASPADLPEPTNGEYIVAARDGYMVMRTNMFGRFLVPTDRAPLTPETDALYWRNIEPKLPIQLIGQAWSFFRAIFERSHSEAMVDIVFDPDPVRMARRAERQGFDDHGYRLFVPPQETTGGGVEAKRNPEHYQGAIVGTIHSHCDFGAWHSGTDTHDADGHDGLHITIGHVNNDAGPSVALMVAASKIRWDVNFHDVTEGTLQLHPHPQWWENFVEEPKKKTTTVQPRTVQARTIPHWVSQHHRQPGGIVTMGNGVILGQDDDDDSWRQTGIWTRDDELFNDYSFETFIWRFKDQLQDDQLMAIAMCRDQVEACTDLLANLGIALDANLSIDPTVARPRSDPHIDQ